MKVLSGQRGSTLLDVMVAVLIPGILVAPAARPAAAPLPPNWSE